MIGIACGGINPSTLGASSLGGSTLGINSIDFVGNLAGASAVGSSPNISAVGGNSSLQTPQQDQPQSQSVSQSPQHFQGTIV